MRLCVELWKARPEWLALSHKERVEYMARGGPMVDGLIRTGVEILGWGLKDSEVICRGEYDFLAAYKMSENDPVRQIEEITEQAGWHKYFEPISATV